MDERDPEVVAALHRRAERGRVRGATAVVAAAEPASAPRPVARWLAAAAVLLIVLVVVVVATRRSDQGVVDRVEVRPTETVGRWTVLPSFTNARPALRPVGTAAGQRVVLVGLSRTGNDPRGLGSRDVAVFDLAGRTWRSVPDPPAPMNLSKQVTADGTRVLVLADAGVPVEGTDQVRMGDLHLSALDPVTGAWTELPVPVPESGQLVLRDGGLVLGAGLESGVLFRPDATGTGWTATPVPGTNVARAARVGDMVVMPGLPNAPAYAVPFAGGDAVTLPSPPFAPGDTFAAGDETALIFDRTSGQLATLDLATRTWTTRASMPPGLRDPMPLGWVDGRFVIYGGMVEVGTPLPTAPGATTPGTGVPLAPSAQGYAWDPSSGRWLPLAPLPPEIPDLTGAVVVGDQLFGWYAQGDGSHELRAVLLSFDEA